MQNDLAEIFREIAKNSGQSLLLTVTKVRISIDLSIAKVYLSIFPSEKADDLVLEIAEMAPQIRHEMAMRVGQQLRKMPEFRFYVDDSLDYIEGIERELKGEGDNPEL